MATDVFIQQLDKLLAMVSKAGEAVMEVYESGDFNVEYKADTSPLTQADKASHQIIYDGLVSLTPSLPVLSEESKLVSYQVRKKWTRYWCVDPLDGTKEFVKRNGEFAINLSLIEENKPILGIIYAPVTKIFYYGMDHYGSWKKTISETPVLLENRDVPDKLVALGSRSHANSEEQKMLEQYHVHDFISIGSSLKFCMLAEGKAHIYYRMGPTMEWDTAAGHAIINNAQCELFQVNGGVFEYNKPNLINPGFICRSRYVKPLIR